MFSFSQGSLFCPARCPMLKTIVSQIFVQFSSTLRWEGKSGALAPSRPAADVQALFQMRGPQQWVNRQKATALEACILMRGSANFCKRLDSKYLGFVGQEEKSSHNHIATTCRKPGTQAVGCNENTTYSLCAHCSTLPLQRESSIDMHK